MKITCCKNKPLLGGILAVEHLKTTHGKTIDIEWSDKNLVEATKCETTNDLLRIIARDIAQKELYAESAVEKTEIDQWLPFSLILQKKRDEFTKNLDILDVTLRPATFLACKRLTIADFAIFDVLYTSAQWQDLISKKEAPVHLLRWFTYIKAQESVQNALSNLPKEALSSLQSKSSRKSPETSNVGNRAREGKFIELPGAEMGKVVVRFPPEASGYLHIGHAKAALLNQYYQEAFQGKLVMRFDDTNPAKEDLHFEQVILEDVEMLEIKPDMFTHTSQYFDLMLEYCEKLLKDGKAYVDDTDPETMKAQREQKIEAASRNFTYEQNAPLWEEMKKGTEKGQKCCVRAKIDMQSPNGCLRDPTIYRCKNEPHPKTGDKYKVYPTYDFACPIVDAIEGVTHTLRTMEYHDRDPQFYWFIEALGLRKPYIWEYSRLSMTNTVLSKRKLTWFVTEGLVDGWDDPRMPTVRGALRRGMTVQGLKEFIIAQGSSRSVVFMEWDKIWAFNKKVIDPIAPRFTALNFKKPVLVEVSGVKEECVMVPKHPKNADIGNKAIWIGSRILIDRVDAESLKEGENATFINWGNLLIKKIHREDDEIKRIEAEPNLENKDYKKTLKLTWLAETDSAKFTPTHCVYFQNIISKPVLAKDEDFKNFLAHPTRTEIQMLGDPELKHLKKGDIIQLQRRGFFKVDVAYKPLRLNTCKEQAVILFYIPDGSSKDATPAPTPPIKTEATRKVNSSKTITATSSKSAASINEEILKQGEVVKNLKSAKAAKDQIDAAVKNLLALKAEYKSATNTDWKPGCVPPAAAAAPAPASSSAKTPASINEEILKQGEVVRNLKSAKAAKDQIDSAVKNLLALKAEYKAAANTEWKPGCVPSSAAPAPASSSAKTPASINEEIIKQGDAVRNLKTAKAAKDQIDSAVKNLLALKAEYKAATNTEWKPGCVPPAAPEKVSSSSSAKTAASINEEIVKQGDAVRNLKTVKATKEQIDAAVKNLLALKAEYKAATNTEWKPGCVPPASSPAPTTPSATPGPDLSSSIAAQGDKVRQLKSEKKEKSIVDAEVKILLSLKQEYKTKFGKDWTPAAAPLQVSVSPQVESKSDSDLLTAIASQGDQVRKLKAEKAAKSEVDAQVKSLLQLKEEFKKLTGKDWKPGMSPTLTAPTPSSGGDCKDALTARITEQGNLVRDLKTKKASKDEIDSAVKSLLDLKAEYKKITGTDFPVAGRAPSKPKQAQEKPAKQKSPQKEKKPVAAAPEDGAGVKKQTRLGLEAKKEENLSDWYSQVITKGEMIEYYDVSGCYIFRPWSFAVWESIKDWFDQEIKKLGVQNCYFPIFVSRSVLEKEKTHIADFAPEVAWVTRSGDSDMAEPIAVRPTSETVMYPAYAKWIQSYRDLPIKLNQWNNVVRWEFKHPQPFLRTREFLWQEGHTAYALKKEATAEVQTILDLYARIYTDLLAIPVVKGRKTEKEKFAGGDYTLTVEAFVSASGRAIQGATSHHLGQNFSKMFDIVFEDPDTQEKKHVYQNSWGITTRTIGVMIMIHADNQGLVLPPRVASVQIVLVPCGITAGLSETARNELQASCDALEAELSKASVRVKGDYRGNYSPGWKFNHWELKGVPIRVELGPKDIEKKQIVAVRRDTGEKITIARASAAQQLTQLLDQIQSDLLAKSTKELNEHKVLLKDWAQFSVNLEKKNIILAPFCGDTACEDKIKADSARDDGDAAEPGAPSMGAKSLCIPLEQPAPIQGNDKCIHPECKRKPAFYTLFGRSY